MATKQEKPTQAQPGGSVQRLFGNEKSGEPEVSVPTSKPTESRPTKPVFRKKEEAPEVSRIDWTLGGMFTGTKPVTCEYTQNFEFSQFDELMAETYEQLKEVEPKFEQELPYCMFQHACCEVLNGYIYSNELNNGDARLRGLEDPKDILEGEKLIVPAAIHEYITQVGDTITANNRRAYLQQTVKICLKIL